MLNTVCSRELVTSIKSHGVYVVVQLYSGVLNHTVQQNIGMKIKLLHGV